ncbi:hypothetical protein [Rhodobacter capsulatus]|uniref:hypothetical protein n=1 Tax=Rhodobacter capsulatus TaxID=1061 RepID=UPI004027E0C8
MAKTLGLDLSLVKQISRALREADMLTTGARGVNAPHMTPLDAARVTLAALAGSIPTTAADDVRNWGSFQISGPISLEGENTKPGPFRETDPDADCTLLEALTVIFTRYGNPEVLDRHVWTLGGQSMEPTLSITLSERPRSVSIVECGAKIVFADVLASEAFRAATEQQRAALARFYAAHESGDACAMDSAQAEIDRASEALAAASLRLLSIKKGIRVTRELKQEEIIPIALALKGG